MTLNPIAQTSAGWIPWMDMTPGESRSGKVECSVQAVPSPSPHCPTEPPIQPSVGEIMQIQVMLAPSSRVVWRFQARPSKYQTSLPPAAQPSDEPSIDRRRQGVFGWSRLHSLGVVTSGGGTKPPCGGPTVKVVEPMSHMAARSATV